jgi:hypothetical protein
MSKTLRPLILCAGSFALGGVVTLLIGSQRIATFFQQGHVVPVAARQSNSASASKASRPVSPLPVPRWGNLDALMFPLGGDDAIYPDRDKRLRRTTWFFENVTESQLAELFRAAGLTPAQQQQLKSPGVLTKTTNGLIVSPPNKFVWTLDSAARRQIYTVLARSETNYSQRFPFRFPQADGFDSRFATIGLTTGQLAKLQHLTYTNFGYVCLSDLQVLSDAFSTNEVNRLIETLYRVPAYRVRLRITPDSDVEALARYWGKGGREKLILPLLQSLKRIPEGASIDIERLLPPTAQVRLDTFPDGWLDPQTREEDCVWTSMNFFRDPPEPRFRDPAYVREILRTEYQYVTGKPTFGDIIALVGPSGNSIHLCIQLADDFVFTKNGLDASQPWAIMKLEDTLACYPSEHEQRLLIFRPRPKTAVEVPLLSHN